MIFLICKEQKSIYRENQMNKKKTRNFFFRINFKYCAYLNYKSIGTIGEFFNSTGFTHELRILLTPSTSIPFQIPSIFFFHNLSNDSFHHYLECENVQNLTHTPHSIVCLYNRENKMKCRHDTCLHVSYSLFFFVIVFIPSLASFSYVKNKSNRK